MRVRLRNAVGVVEPHRPGSRLPRGDASRRPSVTSTAPLLHPDLLMNAHVAGAGSRRPPARRPARRSRRSGWARESWPARCCAARNPTADRATASDRRAGTPGWRRRSRRRRASPAARGARWRSCSSTTAVGLLFPRSTSEIIERLTSHFAASASRVIPRSVRSARTRLAMRALMSGVTAVDVALFSILDLVSSMMDRKSTGRERAGRVSWCTLVLRHERPGHRGVLHGLYEWTSTRLQRALSKLAFPPRVCRVRFVRAARDPESSERPLAASPTRRRRGTLPRSRHDERQNSDLMLWTLALALDGRSRPGRRLPRADRRQLGGARLPLSHRRDSARAAPALHDRRRAHRRAGRSSCTAPPDRAPACSRPTFAGELFGPGQPLDASRYYIILPDAHRHGQVVQALGRPARELSPSTTTTTWSTRQYRLVTEHLGVRHLRLVLGNSMGGMQTWMWAQKYPGFMDVAVPMASLADRDVRAATG